jgi:hypothetical protein
LPYHLQTLTFDAHGSVIHRYPTCDTSDTITAMETKPAKKAKTVERDVADKLIKVKTTTHRLLKIKAAKEGKTIGELLTAFAEAK